jgi:hypothetical protein
MPEASLPITVLRMAGFVALAAVAVAVGGRMLRAGIRTRQLPELMLGSHMLILICGYGLEFAGLAGEQALGESMAFALRAGGNLCYALCILAYLLFNWRVFRPTNPMATTVVAVCTVGLVVGWTGELVTGQFELVPERFALPWFWIAYLPRLVCMAWSSGEGLLRWRMLRRRVRIGVESPLLANRFLCWGLAAAAEVAIYLVAGAALLGPRPTDFLVGSPALLISALGVAASLAIWLAFLPPRSWRQRIESRA